MLNQMHRWAIICLGLVLQFGQTGLYAQRWEVLNKTEGSHWHDIDFVDERNGWKVGLAPGIISHTADGGVTWETQFRFPRFDQSPLAVQFVDASHGWVVGINDDVDQAGLVYRTIDGGKHWEKQEGPPGFLNKAHFVNEREGWVVGLLKAENPGIFKYRAAIAHTTDGGITWQKQWQGDGWNGLTFADSVFFLNNQKGWVAGSGGVILSTEDGGVIWKQSRLNLGRDEIIWKILFLDQQTGWGVGQYAGGEALVLHTADGGNTWRVQYEGQSDQTASDLYFINRQEGWIVGRTYIDDHTPLQGGFVLQRPLYSSRLLDV